MDHLSVTVRTRSLLLIGIGLLAVAVVVAGVVVFRRTASEATPATVVLAAASDPGSDPFVPVASSRPVAVALPPTAEGAAVTASVDPDSGLRMVAGTTDLLYAGRSGDSQELYGGSGSLSACDPAAIAQFLAAHPDKAAAWAGVRGIEPQGIADYLDTLTPVVLLHDTLVTNHGFAGGVANPIVSVLQAGTAVLVDPTGLPVVRCACGNPLSAPPPVDLSTASLQGARWDDYQPGTTLVVTAGSATSELVVVDVATGAGVTVAVGAPVTSSPAPAPATTTSPAGTDVCVLDLTWPDSAPGWIEPLDPDFTCQQMIDQWRRNEQWTGERGGTLQLVEFDDGWYCTGVHVDPTLPRPNVVGSCDLNGRRFDVYQGAAGVRTTVPTATTTGPPTSTSGQPVTTAPAPASSDLLVTPSGNIECANEDGQFACTIKEFDFDLGDERCPGARGPIVRLDATGPSRQSSCRGDFFDGITWPGPTPYGTTATLGDISCDVEQTGLTCNNTEGHGFVLSRSGIAPH